MATNHIKYLNEDELLEGLLKGDVHAFDCIFNKFYGALCLFATRLTSDKFTAEEIVQDIFCKLWSKHNDFNNLNSIKAFLYISTRNASMNALKKQSRKAKHDLQFAFFENGIEEPFINEIIYIEALREISTEVNALPDQCGKIIRMIFEDGLQPKEIADKLDIAISTVYNQKMRGLSILRKRLSDKGLGIITSVILSIYFK
jgi:RNA polymerase sigma-70 factor (ECF subfamily)